MLRPPDTATVVVVESQIHSPNGYRRYVSNDKYLTKTIVRYTSDTKATGSRALQMKRRALSARYGGSKHATLTRITAPNSYHTVSLNGHGERCLQRHVENAVEPPVVYQLALYGLGRRLAARVYLGQFV